MFLYQILKFKQSAEIAILITVFSPIEIKKDKNTDFLMHLKIFIDHFLCEGSGIGGRKSK